MKRLFLIICFTCISFGLIAQGLKPSPYGDRYGQIELNAMKIVKIMEECNFKPVKRTTDIRTFKLLILNLPTNVFEQTSRDTWYLCSYKHDENFEIYNMYYQKISKSYYDDNCNAIISLMIFDGVIKQPQ